MSYKNFDAMLKEKREGRPDFTLGGQQFQCRAKLPWKRFDAIIMGINSEDSTTKSEDFFNLCLVKDDRERFQELLDNDGEDDEDAVIDVTQVNSLMEWLIELYTGKDPKDSSSSESGAPTTGEPLSVVSLNATVPG